MTEKCRDGVYFDLQTVLKMMFYICVSIAPKNVALQKLILFKANDHCEQAEDLINSILENRYLVVLKKCTFMNKLVENETFSVNNK